jgi:hypothetical protein
MKICSVGGCIVPAKYKGLCGKHYKRQWRHGDPNKTLLNMDGGFCKVKDCYRDRRTIEGYCTMHHLRVARYGREHRIKTEDGLGGLDSNGYYVRTVDGVRVYEHILLAERALGKPLPPKAVVHHMNGDKADNYTPFNLVICPDQAYHLLLHRRMKELARREKAS